MKQLSLFKEETQVGDKVFICSRPCTVKRKFWADPLQNGGELYYEIHDPTGLGATFILRREHFETEEAIT